MALQFADVIRVHQKEKAGLAPTQLPTGFYADLNALIEQARTEYERYAVDDPTSMRASQMLSVLQKLRDFQNEIVNIRTRKLLLIAHQSMCGGSPDKQMLVPVEVETLDTIIATLASLRAQIRAETASEKKDA